jgi:hypothetical protein
MTIYVTVTGLKRNGKLNGNYTTVFFSSHKITLDATNCKVAYTFNTKRTVLRVSVSGKNVIKINETTLQHTLRTKEYESKQTLIISGSLHGYCSDDTLLGFDTAQFVNNDRRLHFLSDGTGPGRQ